MSKSIHFILPGGGVRGSFQAGFLYELFTKYHEYFHIYRIDGTSVGSINGIITILGEYETLNDIWLNINNINDFFGNWSDIPVVGNLSSIYYGFYNNGMYNNQSLREKLELNLTEKKKLTDKSILEKYSCTTTNVNKATIEYIYGPNDKLFDYITASASPWIISNPVKINNTIYTDGGVLETYPLHNVEHSNADLIIIVGFDQEIVQFEEPDCSNLLLFLATLLDIARFNSINSGMVRDYIHNGRCIPIINTMKCLFTDFDQETIKLGFIQGQEAAEQFYKTYLI